MTTKKAGRPKLPGRVKLTITMDNAIYKLLSKQAGSKSGVIERALMRFFENEKN